MTASPEIHDLSGLYALGALPADECRTYESHLAECRECAREVESFRTVVTELAIADAREPGPGLRRRVLADISAHPQQRQPPIGRVMPTDVRLPVPSDSAQAAAQPIPPDDSG